MIAQESYCKYINIYMYLGGVEKKRSKLASFYLFAPF